MPSPQSLAPPLGAAHHWALHTAFADLHPTPWTNGLGVTTQIMSPVEAAAISPHGASAWRLSVANLANPARFSTLPGWQRTFLPIGGEVTLRINGSLVTGSPESAVQFDGSDQVELVSLAEPCFAVNFMAADNTVALTTTPAPPGTALFAIALTAGTHWQRFDTFVPTATTTHGVPVTHCASVMPMAHSTLAPHP